MMGQYRAVLVGICWYSVSMGIFLPRISGNVMTLTGVCKGLSIVAFLAGLRFRLNISIISIIITSIIITSIIIIIIIAFLAGLRFRLKISFTIREGIKKKNRLFLGKSPKL